MWKQLLQLATKFWKLADETQRNSTEIREVRQELNEMGKVLDRVLLELERLKENEAHEREKLTLRLENALLRFERRLPHTKSDVSPP